MQLAGGIAHDFNNLLAVISGNLELILRKPQEVARVGHVAKAALQAAQRGERLIKQLLMFSRRQVMRPTTLKLNSVLLEFETLLRHVAGAPIELGLKLDSTLDIVNIDRSQFEPAMLNMVVNARDALPKGGRITIATANAVIGDPSADENTELAPGPYAVLTVSDSGIGIAPSVLPHVFEPFFTTKEVGKGSGLGLSQVYGFAVESGGHVRIHSRIGRGTTIRLYLPTCTDYQSKNESRSTATIPQVSGGGTVLVVENDESVLETAKETVSTSVIGSSLPMTGGKPFKS